MFKTTSYFELYNAIAFFSAFRILRTNVYTSRIRNFTINLKFYKINKYFGAL